MVSSTCPAESTNLMTGLYCQMVLHGLIHLLLTSASAHLVIRPVEFRLLSLLKGLLNFNLNSISISANWASVSFWVVSFCFIASRRMIEPSAAILIRWKKVKTGSSEISSGCYQRRKKNWRALRRCVKIIFFQKIMVRVFLSTVLVSRQLGSVVGLP